MDTEDLQDVRLEGYKEVEKEESRWMPFLLASAMIILFFILERNKPGPITTTRRFFEVTDKNSLFSHELQLNITNKRKRNPIEMSVFGFLTTKRNFEHLTIRYNTTHIIKTENENDNKNTIGNESFRMAPLSIKNSISESFPLYKNITGSFINMLANVTIQCDFHKIDGVGIEVHAKNKEGVELYSRVTNGSIVFLMSCLIVWSILCADNRIWSVILAEVSALAGGALGLLGFKEANIAFSLCAAFSAFSLSSIAVTISNSKTVESNWTPFVVFAEIAFLGLFGAQWFAPIAVGITFAVAAWTGYEVDVGGALAATAVAASLAAGGRVPVCGVFAAVFAVQGSYWAAALPFLVLCGCCVLGAGKPVRVRGVLEGRSRGFQRSADFYGSRWQMDALGALLEAPNLSKCDFTSESDKAVKEDDSGDLVVGLELELDRGPAIIDFVRTLRQSGYRGRAAVLTVNRHLGVFIEGSAAVEGGSRLTRAELGVRCGVAVASIGFLSASGEQREWAKFLLIHDFLRANGELFERVFFANTSATTFKQQPFATDIDNNSVYLVGQNREEEYSTDIVWGGSNALYSFSRAMVDAFHNNNGSQSIQEAIRATMKNETLGVKFCEVNNSPILSPPAQK